MAGGASSQCRGQERALAARWLGRPGSVDEDAAYLRTAPATSCRANTAGRNLHFGVREHAMAAAVNGMTVCADCGPTAHVLRLQRLPAALDAAAPIMNPVDLVFTHDSIGVGEDGPTHQPVEQLAAMRAIPNLLMMRPADANEVSVCYRAASKKSHRPTVMARLDKIVRRSIENNSDLPSVPCLVAISSLTPHWYADVIPMVAEPNCNNLPDGGRRIKESENSDARREHAVLGIIQMNNAQYCESVLPAAVTRRIAVEAGIRMGLGISI